MAGLVTKTSNLVKLAITEAKPALKTIQYYAKVELIPPKPSEIPAIRSGIANLISSVKNGKYKELTVKDAWLNTLVAVEVYCWFYIGECIGKRHLVGYDI